MKKEYKIGDAVWLKLQTFKEMNGMLLSQPAVSQRITLTMREAEMLAGWLKQAVKEKKLAVSRR